jgi:hypothetical protein
MMVIISQIADLITFRPNNSLSDEYFERPELVGEAYIGKAFGCAAEECQNTRKGEQSVISRYGQRPPYIRFYTAMLL